MIEKEEQNTYVYLFWTLKSKGMHRAVKKYGSQVLLNSSGKFGISPEF
jgi:hypothetical protein